ncbi:MAG: VTT domain-containing protein [Oscillospiraceae bacterium]|nr:VTT domain-containing protein [Oscillospiraceae bacterium]
MNILVTIDANYVPQTAVLLRSLLHSNPDEFFTVYVAHSSLTDRDFEKIGDGIDSNRCVVVPVPVSESLFSGETVLGRIPKETYYRLFAIDFLPEDVERILYLDADTVAINSLRPYYDLDFGGSLIAASSHTFGLVEFINRVRLKSKGRKYVNAGVMLMNIQGMRICGITTEDIRRYIKANAKKLILADQDVINALYGDRILQVDPRLFNLDEKVFMQHGGQIDLDWVKANTAVVHYNGADKPWNPNYSGRLAIFYERHSEGLDLPREEAGAPESGRSEKKGQTGGRKKKIIAGIVLVSILAALAAAYLMTGKQLLEFFKDSSGIKVWLDGFGVWGRIIFIAVRAFQTVIKIIPAEPLEIGAGYAFGTWGGLLFCMLGTLAGSLIIIMLAKIFGAKLLNLFVPAKKLRSFAFARDSKKLTAALFVMYLIPGTPKDLFTYMAPFLPMKISRFLLITGIARIPSILMSTWIGEELTEKNYIAAAVIFAATLLISGVYMLVSKNRAAAAKSNA